MSSNYVTRTELMDFMNGVDETFRETLSKHRLELAQRDERIAELTKRIDQMAELIDQHSIGIRDVEIWTERHDRKHAS